MKEKIKNIWKRACAFFTQADKQKHFTVGALACALVTIAVVLQDIPLGLTPAGAQKFTYFTSIQHTYNGYSVLFRNDGDNFYIMLTNKGSNDFNSFRPIRINIKTGDVELCCGKLYIDHDGEVRIPGALRVGQLIQSVAADEPTGEHTME